MNPRLRIVAAALLFLAPAAAADEPFKGWVNISATHDRAQPPMMSYSTIDHSQATIYNDRKIHFQDKITQRSVLYDPDSKTIFINRIHPAGMHRSFDDAARHLGLFVSLPAMMDHWKQENPGEDVKIEKLTDEGFERYVLTFAATNRQTFWFDPKTKLLAKVRAEIGDKDWMLFYRYDDPVVREIYDLGVPRSTKTVDNRPRGELKTVLDRVDAKIDSGFGDGVAVLTETPLDSAGQLAHSGGRLHLFAQQGNRWLSHLYLAGPRGAALQRTGSDLAPPIALPRHWPQPDIAELLDPLLKAIPNATFVSDGAKRWRADFIPIGERSGHLADDRYEWRGPDVDDKPYFALAGRIWPGSYTMEMFSPRAAAELKRDPARPGQLGMVVSAPNCTRELWIDPARDDVPIEHRERRLNKEGRLHLEEHTRFEEFAQLPSGRWYPTRWTHTLRYDLPGFAEAGTKVCHLKVDPSLRLRPSWFSNPVDRLGSTTRPITLPPPPTSASTTRKAK